MTDSPSIVVLNDDGEVERELATPSATGAVDREWWPILDAQDVCRYCLHAYPFCTCEEAEGGINAEDVTERDRR